VFRGIPHATSAVVSINLEDLVFEDVGDEDLFCCGFLPWDAREEHEAHCTLRPNPCRLNCGQWIQDRFARVRGTCPDGFIKPIGSHVLLCQEHVLFSCPMRPKPCAHGCGQLLNDEDKMIHENEDCPFR
jgi:hypothetical protein